jgi:hypothetical protein
MHIFTNTKYECLNELKRTIEFSINNWMNTKGFLENNRFVKKLSK